MTKELSFVMAATYFFTIANLMYSYDEFFPSRITPEELLESLGTESEYYELF